MDAPHRYIDPFGNVTERFNESGIHEQAYYLSPPDRRELSDYEYPLTISCSGNGIWDNDARFKLMRCDRFAAELITAGNMRFVQDGKEYEVVPGTVFFLRPGSLTECAVGSAGFLHKRFVILYGRDLDQLRNIYKLTDCDLCALDDPRRLATLIQTTTRLLRDRPDNFQYSISVVAYEIMLLLSIAVAGRRFPPPISAALHHMNRRIYQTVTIRELCAAAGVSRSHFHRLFNEHVGEHPLGYFMNMKIRHIAAQLRNSPQRTIGDIARENSFEDQAYFTHVFRKIMGVPPGEYRRGGVTP